MCRGETCAQEKIQAPEEEFDEVFDEEEYEEGESIVEEVPEFDAAVHALWVMRETFKMLDDGQSIVSEGSAPPPPSDEIWTWESHLAPGGGSAETVWRRSMHQMSTTNMTLGDERGYESA